MSAPGRHASYTALLGDGDELHLLPHALYVALVTGQAQGAGFAGRTMTLLDWRVALDEAGNPVEVVGETTTPLTFDADGRVDWKAAVPPGCPAEPAPGASVATEAAGPAAPAPAAPGCPPRWLSARPCVPPCSAAAGGGGRPPHPPADTLDPEPCAMCICFDDTLRQWTRPEAAETRETALRAWGVAVREAAALQDDLRRARIEPHAWVVNRSLAGGATRDPVLAARMGAQRTQIERVLGGLARRAFVVPWRAQPPRGVAALRALVDGEGVTS